MIVRKKDVKHIKAKIFEKCASPVCDGLGRWFRITHPPETNNDKCHYICTHCGHS